MRTVSCVSKLTFSQPTVNFSLSVTVKGHCHRKWRMIGFHVSSVRATAISASGVEGGLSVLFGVSQRLGVTMILGIRRYL